MGDEEETVGEGRKDDLDSQGLAEIARNNQGNMDAGRISQSRFFFSSLLFCVLFCFSIG